MNNAEEKVQRLIRKTFQENCGFLRRKILLELVCAE